MDGLVSTGQQHRQWPPQPLVLDNQCSYCSHPHPSITTSSSTTTPPTPPLTAPPKKSLYLCAGCRVVRYCCREHQISHWAAHKPLCLPVKRAKAVAEAEERKIKMNPDSFRGKDGVQEGWEAFYMPGDPFEHAIDFWEWDATRPYMRARWNMVDGLRRIPTTEALQWALGHAMGVLQLNRSDALGVRHMVPAMMLRLGNDQEAYDFVKWWATTGRQKGRKYDWGDPDAPYLELRGENMMEGVELWTEDDEQAELADQVAVLVIKVRLLFHREARLRTLWDRAIRTDAAGVSRQRSESRRRGARRDSASSIVEITTVSAKPSSPPPPALLRLTQEHDMLKVQAEGLVAAIHRSNDRLLPVLAGERDPPVQHSQAPLVDGWERGSLEEMQAVLQYTGDAWTETRGAVDWLREQLAAVNTP